MKYENLKKFIISTKASKSTIYRFYKKNEDLFAETELRSGKRMFLVDHARYFDSEVMFDENKILRQENKSMRNLIDCLADKESLQHTFWQMDWNFFFTVAYKTDRNKTSCFKQMHGLKVSKLNSVGLDFAGFMFFNIPCATILPQNSECNIYDDFR